MIDARLVAAALIGVLAGAGGLYLSSEMLVRRALLASPEIIPEAMETLRARETAKVITQHRAALETPFASAWAGARDADVVMVQFFDYSCGYCAKSNADVERLLREDSRLKVVWREWPVLGPESEQAALASLAAARAGGFREFHRSRFGGDATTNAAIADPGDVAEIRRNDELARRLGATGTPTFVIGDQMLQGAAGYAALKAAIAAARG